MVRRGEVYWVNLDPIIGTEINKFRPGLVVSPDDLNQALPRVVIAPPTSKVEGRPARILLDQLRSIDKTRILGRLGSIDESLWHETLLEMLASRPLNGELHRWLLRSPRPAGGPPTAGLGRPRDGQG